MIGASQFGYILTKIVGKATIFVAISLSDYPEFSI